MNKPVVWSQNAKNDLKRIKKFYDTRNQSSIFSKMLLKTFRDSTKIIEIFPNYRFLLNMMVLEDL